MSSFSGQVAQSTDDGSQNSSGTVVLTATNTVLSQLGSNSRYWAFRIEDVAIPPGATIESASLSLYAPNASDVGMDANIFGNLTPNPGTLQSTSDYISGLAQTTNSVAWSATLTSGQFNQSPDISAIITELIAQADWAEGNAMLFVLQALSATKLVEIENYDGSSSEAPQLSIAFTAVSIAVLTAYDDPMRGGFCN